MLDHTTLASPIDDIPLLQLAEWLQARLAREVGTMSRSVLEQVASSYKAVYLEAQYALDATYRLSPEVLGLIFRYVPGTPLNDLTDQSIGGRPLCFKDHDLVRSRDVIPLTHVCRRWRAITIGLPELWTTIDGTKQIPYDVQAMRSRTRPLKVFIHSYLRSEFRRWLRTHASDVQEFHYIYAANADRYAVLMTDYPNVRAATLVDNNIRIRDTQCELFGGSTSLRSLCMQGISWLPTNHFPHLTRLYLGNQPEHGTGSMAEFAAFLARCPNLVDLILLHWHFGQVTLTPEIGSAQLPQLRRLTLQGFHQGEIMIFLSHIYVPADAALCVRMMHNPVDLLDVVAVSSFPALESCNRVQIIKSASVFSMTALGHTSGVYIQKFDIKDELPPRGGKLAKIIPLPHLEELWLVERQSCEPMPSEVLRDLLRPIRALRKLVITSEGLPELNHVLRFTNIDATARHPPIHEIHILVNSPPKNSRIVVKCMKDFKAAKIAKVVIVIPKDYPAVYEPALAVAGFDFVELRRTRAMPCIELPSVCATRSELWPSWDNFLTLA
ncbi:hypothetical protein EVJ58_g5207 [Rhodofomes roseus]|uniref:Uncharacterized protein n=1 Tax=Rhodofomes roseus TaxID=34475 RepID=A0A4Y9YCT1_9APHY|nr:hypothetical protein EVJ58_g5207 [Rhodofomes roseus]